MGAVEWNHGPALGFDVASRSPRGQRQGELDRHPLDQHDRAHSRILPSSILDVLSNGPGAASGPATGRALQLLKDWFWRPPRAHGETIVDRRVSPLELLYDLAYATVIAQAGNHPAAPLSANGLFEFAVVFSLTWIAWANGSR